MSPQEGGATSFPAQHLLSFSPHPIPGEQEAEMGTSHVGGIHTRSVEQIPEGMKVWDYSNPGQ